VLCGFFFFVLCTLCCQFLWIVFVLFIFVLCTLCCQFLWIVTEGAIKKGQSRETGNIGYTINVREYRRGNQKRTIQRNWQHRVHKTKINKTKSTIFDPLSHIYFAGKVCQSFATCRWFSPGTPVSSTNKTDRHDIIEILLKVALNTINKLN
jgi:hypothetical protein